MWDAWVSSTLSIIQHVERTKHPKVSKVKSEGNHWYNQCFIFKTYKHIVICVLTKPGAMRTFHTQKLILGMSLGHLVF